MMPRDPLQRVRDAGLTVHEPYANRVIISKLPEPQFGGPECVLIVREGGWTFSMLQWMPGPGPDDFVCEFTTLDEAVDAVFDFYVGAPTMIDGWLLPFHRHPELSRERVSSRLPQAVLVTAERFQEIQEEHRNLYMRVMEEAERPMQEWWDQISDFARDELSGKDEWERLRIVCELEDAGKVPKRPARSSFLNYEWAMRTQFLSIQHAQDQTKSLRVRRDLQEMYIVALAETVRSLPP